MISIMPIANSPPLTWRWVLSHAALVTTMRFEFDTILGIAKAWLWLVSSYDFAMTLLNFWCKKKTLKHNGTDWIDEGNAPYGLPDWKNRPVPGRMSYKATKPGPVLSLNLPSFLGVPVVLLTMATFLLCYFVLLVYTVSWLFWLGCQYQCKWLTGKTRLRNDL